MIYHMIKIEEWDLVKENTHYSPKSLETDGFIHCSDLHQVIKVSNFNFAESELLVLCIDESKLLSKVVYEDLYQLNEDYPHIYGMINVDAVVDSFIIKIGEDGTYNMPE